MSHPSLFHTATSLLNWYKMACMANILHRLIWVKFMSILSMYVQSGTHKHFHWRIIAVLTQNPTVLMVVDITGAPKLYRKCVETCVFVAVSEQWRLGKNIRGSCHWREILRNFDDCSVIRNYRKSEKLAENFQSSLYACRWHCTGTRPSAGTLPVDTWRN